jgi:tRNA(Ile)-lysidine synthase
MRATGVRQGVLSPEPASLQLAAEGQATPVVDAEFAAAMARLGPFESRPFLAVAVSGGADSLALLILAERWARERGGRVAALTVDHRLREAAAGEAASVARFCAARGIGHETLTLAAPRGGGNVEAAAREARYARLAAWCLARGSLHLLVAHHREDQAETVLLRLARGSGVDGLAAMAPVRELPECRLLRPLLGVPRARLRALLAAEGVTDRAVDPMNADPRFARARLRRAAALLESAGLSPERLAATAARLGDARAALEADVADLLARAVAIDPAGYAWLDPAPLARAPREIRLRALARVVTTVSGRRYPPRYDRLLAAASGLTAARTLGGCRLVPRDGRILVCREAAAAAGPEALAPGRRVLWDGRFLVALAAGAPDGLTIGALGRETLPEPVRGLVPAPARAALPALRDEAGVVAVPPLGFFAAGQRSERLLAAFSFQPARTLASAGFTVV